MSDSKDPSTFSNYSDIHSSHLHFELDFDFNTQIITGFVTHTLKRVNENCNEIIFDTRDLTIHSVLLTSSQSPLEYKLGDSSEALGTPLLISLPSSLSLQPEEEFKITIHYSTSKDSVGIKWLDPQQTEGKRHPYLFTQFQAIHCRSAIPCQDTPAKKITFTAKLSVPSPLIALMSAISISHDRLNNSFLFNQKITVPTYLIAFAVGELESREIGPRSKVWAEKSVVDIAAHEFSETEDYLRTAEQITTPYEWERYDILCLPGSFPYGGMENPCLTFVTPTLLAGDRSLTSVVAHEIAHSWTGNLVTNESWNDFWLNEGFTVFLERKIIGRMFGKPRQHFDYLLGNFDLNDAIHRYGLSHPFTSLVHKLDGIDPDDAFSAIPYEKGSQFLFYLEHRVGGEEKFEPAFKEWIEMNRLRSTTSLSFQKFFQSKFPEVEIDWEKWFYQPGLPPFDITTLLDHSLASSANELASLWTSDHFTSSSVSANDIKGWSSDQIVYLLDKIKNISKEKGKLSIERIELMESVYHFTKTKNSEIRFSWLSLCLISGYEKIFPEVVNFVTIQGRMKFIRPMYRLLAASGDNGKQLAIDTFTNLKNNYHNIAKKLVEDDLTK